MRSEEIIKKRIMISKNINALEIRSNSIIKITH